MHEALKRMLNRYAIRNLSDSNRALREIIQEIALVGLWRGKFFEYGAFYGGTALRILYGLDRFSEDLDFTLLKPNPAFSLNRYHKVVQEELQAFGFTVDVLEKKKSWDSPVQSAFIKTEAHHELLRIGISDLLLKGFHRETLLKVKFEVDINPPQGASYEARTINEPFPVSIKTLSLSDLFAGKMHALLCRAWKGRIKGRDWYDFVWFVRQDIPLNLDYLASRMQQSGHLGPEHSLNVDLFKQHLEKKIAELDMGQALDDVRPFVQDTAAISSWSGEFFREFAKRMRILEKK